MTSYFNHKKWNFNRCFTVGSTGKIFHLALKLLIIVNKESNVSHRGNENPLSLANSFIFGNTRGMFCLSDEPFKNFSFVSPKYPCSSSGALHSCRKIRGNMKTDATAQQVMISLEADFSASFVLQILHTPKSTTDRDAVDVRFWSVENHCV